MGESSQHASEASDALAGLSPAQRGWVMESERLWRRAHAIARAHPTVDVTDLYHALRCLQLTPSARLALGFRRGRLRTAAR